MKIEKNFKITALEKVKVRFSDTDAAGVVHHKHYLDYLEAARISLFVLLGFNSKQFFSSESIIPVVASYNITILQSAFFDDVLNIEAKIASFDNVQMQISYLITRGGDTLVSGFTSHAFVNRQTYSLTRIPKEIISKIKEHE